MKCRGCNSLFNPQDVPWISMESYYSSIFYDYEEEDYKHLRDNPYYCPLCSSIAIRAIKYLEKGGVV